MAKLKYIVYMHGQDAVGIVYDDNKKELKIGGKHTSQFFATCLMEEYFETRILYGYEPFPYKFAIVGKAKKQDVFTALRKMADHSIVAEQVKALGRIMN